MRHPVFVCFVALGGLFLFASLFFGSPFKTRTEVDTAAWLGEHPLDLAAGLETFQSYLNSEEGQQLADSWGLHLGPSQPARLAAFPGLGGVTAQLNGGIDQLEKERLTSAKGYLSGNYDTYIKEVRRQHEGRVDLIPVSENEQLLYILTRYHRALLAFEFAERNSRDRQNVAQLLRESLYDLRRCVAASEQLGARGNQAYWGHGTQAWEGVALKPEHGGLPIGHIYQNLALAYLRLGDTPGYPQPAIAYLAREHQKYSWGEDAQLTPIVNDLIQRVLSSEISLPMYRYVMALHNLEAAGRGQSSEQEISHRAYTVGLILRALADLPSSGVDLAQVPPFFKQAQESAGQDAGLLQLALKEQILLAIRLGRFAEAQTLLPQVDVGALEQVQRGPEREMNQRFVDLAQLLPLCQGQFDRVDSYLDRRSHELGDEKHRQHYETLLGLLAQGYARALEASLSTESPAVQASLLHQLRHASWLEGRPHFEQAIQSHLLEPALRDPRVALNYWLRQNAGWRNTLLGLTGLSFLLWVAYLVWSYKSHKRWAQHYLTTGYGK